MRTFLKGNDAVVSGALYAGCRAFFGYPITPASEIAHGAMKAFPEAGALAIQAESEVAAINMLYGAGACGIPGMTATSGPGLSLMQEGISYMAAARLPGVIVDIMRSGPGLGNIAPEQSDYFVATHGGGHGHYHCPVFAPASVEEMFSMTYDAFQAAFQYQTPAFVLADAFIGQMMETLHIPDTLLDAAQAPDVRWPLPHAIRCDEITAGNIVSSLELCPPKLQAKNDIRFACYDEMQQQLPQAEIDVQTDAQTLVIAFGICARMARDAVQKARQDGHRITFFRPKTLWPFPQEALQTCAQNAKRIIVAECNRGMMRLDVERMLKHSNILGCHADGGVLPDIDAFLTDCLGSDSSKI